MLSARPCRGVRAVFAERTVPFTPAHAAAVLPLRRVAPRLPLAALVVGSMGPDLPYLLTLDVTDGVGHTAVGHLTVAWPLAGVALAAWHGLGRRGLAALLPPGWTLPAREPVPVLRQALALLLGVWTHVAWDGLTHRTGWAPALWPALARPVATGWPPTRIAQHASTLLGLALLAWAAGPWTRRQARPSARQLAPLAALGAVAVLGGLANAVRLAHTGAASAIVAGGVGVTATLAAALLLAGAVAHARPCPPAPLHASVERREDR